MKCVKDGELQLSSPHCIDRGTAISKVINAKEILSGLTYELPHFDPKSLNYALDSLLNQPSIVMIVCACAMGTRVAILSSLDGSIAYKIVALDDVHSFSGCLSFANHSDAVDWQKSYEQSFTEHGANTDQFMQALNRFADSFSSHASPLINAISDMQMSNQTRIPMHVICGSDFANVPFHLTKLDKVSERFVDRFRLQIYPTVSFAARALASANGRTSASVAIAQQGEGFVKLPQAPKHAALETEHIKSAFKERAIEVTSDSPCSTQDILQSMEGVDIWHFSGHGVREESETGVALPGGSIMTPTKLLRCSITRPPRLVVLSACETGRSGASKFSSEFEGLVSAFLHMNVGGVVASLWPVSDEATAELFCHFYDALSKKRDLHPADALLIAQNMLRNSNSSNTIDYITENQFWWLESFKSEATSTKKFSDPFYWGGFVYYGA